MKMFNKLEAIKYLIDNNVYCDEWSGAGMYNAISDLMSNENEEFTEEYLKALLEEAENF